MIIKKHIVTNINGSLHYNGLKIQNKKNYDSYKRDVLPSPSVDLTGGMATVALGGGGTSCLATLAHLAPHHHLPSHTADLTVGHGTRDSHPDEVRDKKEKYMNYVFTKTASCIIENISQIQNIFNVKLERMREKKEGEI